MYSLNIKFQEKIFTAKKVIKLWNFGYFGIPKIIPKSLVTLRFSKVSLHELKGICKCFQMRYWPNFYVDSTYSNTCFFKVDKRRVLLQGTVRVFDFGTRYLGCKVRKANFHFDCINAIYDQFLKGGGQNPLSRKIGLSA